MKTYYLLFILILFVASYSKAQNQPELYYHFDQNAPYLNSGAGIGCTCTFPSGLTGINPSGINGVIVNPTTDGYMQFVSNGSTALNNEVVINLGPASHDISAITVEMLFKFGKTFDVHYRPYFFRLTQGTGSGAPLMALATFEYPNIKLVHRKGANSNDDPTVNVALDGIGPKGFNYYLDDKWHHIAFVINHTTTFEELKIYIDGLLINTDFENIIQNVPPGYDNILYLNTTNALKLSEKPANLFNQFFGGMDEFALFYEARNDQQIYADYSDAILHQQLYTLTSIAPPATLPQTVGNYDPTEHPLNFSPLATNAGGDYSIVNTAENQITHFVLPRYKPSVDLHKNMSWLKSRWMVLNEGTLGAQVTSSVNIQKELAKNWNYYFNVAENLSTQVDELNDIATEFPAAWVHEANSNNYKLGVITSRAQINPLSTLGSGSPNNPCNFTRAATQTRTITCSITGSSPFTYLLNANGDTIRPRNSSIPWSIIPNTSGNLSYYAVDGFVMEENFKRLYGIGTTNGTVHLTRALDMISENNEQVVDYVESTIINNPTLINYCSGCTTEQNAEIFQAQRKLDIDNQYSNTFLNSSTLNTYLQNAMFLNYAVDGHSKEKVNGVGKELFDDRHYYPIVMRSQKKIDNAYYSTPDLYFSSPHNWNINSGGPIHGWNWLALSRFNETTANQKFKDSVGNFYPPLDQKYYAPFVAPGYIESREERCMRPAQYLGMLKAMLLLGVDFFHPGFFANDLSNIPGGNGRSYAWQASTPSYAQAIRTRCQDYFDNGVMMPGDIGWNLQHPPGDAEYLPSFRFNGGNPNQLIVVRQLTGATKYLISGSVQRLTNYVGEIPLNEDATINLGSPPDLKFNIRQQGSTYIYEYDANNSSNSVFYQLDKWHQYEHPERWSKDFDIEAEVYDNTPTAAIIKTENPNPSGQSITNNDYRQFVSHVSGSNNLYEYNFNPRSSHDRYIFIRARLANGSNETNSKVTVSVNLNSTATSPIIDSKDVGVICSNNWLWYNIYDVAGDVLHYLMNAENQKISIQASNNDVYIDRIYVGETPNAPFNEPFSLSYSCVPNNIKFTVTSTPVKCYGGNDGQIQVIIPAGTGPYDYSINGSTWQSSSVFTGLSSNVNNPVRIRDFSGNISAIQNIIISQPPAMTIQFQTKQKCAGLNDGKLTAVISGGTGPFTYVWSTGSTNNLIENLAATTYTVVVTDSMKCVQSASTSLTDPQAFTASASKVGSTGTCGARDIQISSITNGYSPFQLSINAGTNYSTPFNSNSNTQASITPGIYNLILKDNQGCIANISPSSTITIPSLSPSTFSASLTINNISPCNGDENGSLTIVPSIGSGNTFSWLGTSSAASTRNNLSPGSYTGTVTHALCPYTVSAIITEPPVLTTSYTSTPVTCKGSSNGSLVITPIGGVSPYHFLGSPSSTFTVKTIINLNGGTYPYIFYDVNGCSVALGAHVQESSKALTVTFASTNPNCSGNNGSITAIGDGGTGPYTYLWSNSATTKTISNLTDGTYTVTITDTFLCTNSTSQTISRLTLNTSVTNVSCNGGSNGALTANVSGGTGPYTYLWSNTATTATISGLTANTYTVTVTDGSNCTASTSATLTQPSPITATLTATNLSCFQSNNGFITISSISNATSPYTFGTDGTTFPYSNPILNLSASTFNVYIKDNNGCIKNLGSATITQPTAITISNINITNTSCGSSNGAISFTTSGGTSTGTYNFLWSTGSTCNAATSCSLNNLAATTYIVTATDNNSCSKSQSFTVNANSTLQIQNLTINSPTCIGGLGSITITATGGSGTLYYSLDNSTYQPSSTFLNLTAGTYHLYVKDASNCIVQTQVVMNPTTINCCTPGYSDVVQHDFDNSSSTNPITGLHNLNVPITISSGTAYISACTMVIAKNVSITVNAGATLIIQNQSTLSSCGEMWQGIINLGGTVIVESSSIEDAIDALRTEISGSTFQISRSHFVRNYNSVSLINGDYSTSYFYENDFEGGQSLKNSFGSTLDQTNTHFFIADARVVIGNVGMGTNTFRSGTYGIFMTGSTLDIDNCTFDQPGVVNNYIGQRAGIYCNRQNVLNCGINNINSINKPVTFQNGPQGIYQLGNTDAINVKYCAFAHLDAGIRCEYTGITDLIVDSNTFADCNDGMFLSLVNSSEDFEILDNEFDGATDATSHYPENYNAIGIYYPMGYDFNMQVSRNIINDYPIGIYALNLFTKSAVQKISENTITYLNIDDHSVGLYPHGMRGIQLQNCYHTLVTDNSVVWTLGPTDPIGITYDIRGIYFDNSQMCLIKDNYVEKMGNGIYGSNRCEETALKCNTVVNCYPSGMNFENIVLPNQGSYCNPTYNNWYGAYDQSINGVSKIDGYGNPIDWYYDGSVATSNPMYPRPSPSALIFDINVGGCVPTDYPCTINNQERYSGDPNARSSNIDLIVQDAKTYIDNIDENKYYDKDYAFKMMKNDSTLITDELHEDFMQLHSEDPIGLLSQVQDLTIANNIAAAAQINDVVYDQNLIEQNKKIVNEIFLASDNLDSIFKSDSTVKPILESIAYQSSISGGQGVYWARGLLKLRIEDSYTPSSARFSSNQKVVNYLNDVKLYPNPTNNYVFVEALKDGLISQIEVFDSRSSLVSHNIEKSNKIKVNTANLKDGFYTLVVRLEDNSLHYLKLSIIH